MSTAVRGSLGRLRKPRLGPFASVAGGSVIGQIALAASLPLVARLYSPTEVGIFALLLAYSQVVSIVLTGRLEQVLPRLAQPRRWIVTRLVLGLGTLLAPAAAIVVVRLADRDGWDEFAAVSLLVASLCAYNSTTFALLAEQQYKTVASIRASNGIVTGIAQVVGGLVLPEVTVLVFTYALGSLVAVLSCLPSLVRLRNLSGHERLPLVWREERLGRFAASVGPGALMSSLALALPLIGITALFGEAAGASFYLARRLLMVPTQLVAASVSEVSYALVARETVRHIEEHVHGWLRKAPVLAAMLMVLGLLMAPAVSFVVGDGYPWIAWLVVLLTPAAVVQMVATSLSNVLLALHMELIRTVWNVCRLAGLVGVFWVTETADLPLVSGVAVLAAYTATSYALLLWLTLRGIRVRRSAA